jgi:hypothetical protein
VGFKDCPFSILWEEALASFTNQIHFFWKCLWK